MSEAASEGGDLSEEVAAVRAQLDELTDLFRRRLSDDRDKRRLLEQLDEQSRFARDGLAQQYLLPLVRELLLVADRAAASGDAEAESIGAELVEVLYRHGIETVDASGEFDPAEHEAARSIPAPAGSSPGAIAVVERPGFRFGATLVRPARVVVYAPLDSAVKPPAISIDVEA